MRKTQKNSSKGDDKEEDKDKGKRARIQRLVE